MVAAFCTLDSEVAEKFYDHTWAPLQVDTSDLVATSRTAGIRAFGVEQSHKTFSTC